MSKRATTKPTRGPALRKRLVDLFKMATGSEHGDGAITWSAAQLCVSRSSIMAWTAGRRNMRPVVRRVLELLETCIEHGISDARILR